MRPVIDGAPFNIYLILRKYFCMLHARAQPSPDILIFLPRGDDSDWCVRLCGHSSTCQVRCFDETLSRYAGLSGEMPSNQKVL